MKGTRKKYDAKFKEFIDNSAVAFEALKVDDTAIEKEKDRYLRVIDDLQMQLDLPSVSFGVARQRQSELCLCTR